MKKMLKFLRKVKKNKDGLYQNEADLVMEIKLFIAMAFFAFIFLITPWGRVLLKWIAYIGAGFMVIASMGLVYSDYLDLKKSNKYDEKLEKLGTSREEENRMRTQLCEMEGDDALSPQKKFVYFADASALAYYADALYGCFLAQTFRPKYMQLPEDAVLYTTQTELNKLRKMEFEATDKKAPYMGYTGFIRANIKVLQPVRQTTEQEIIETLLKFQLELEPEIDVAIVSTNETLLKEASQYTFELINPVSMPEAEGGSTK